MAYGVISIDIRRKHRTMISIIFTLLAVIALGILGEMVSGEIQ